MQRRKCPSARWLQRCFTRPQGWRIESIGRRPAAARQGWNQFFVKTVSICIKILSISAKTIEISHKIHEIIDKFRVKVIVPREGIKPLLGQNQTIETNDCFAALVDPDPVEQESPDIILACGGQKANLSEFLYDVATILMEEESIRTKTHLSVQEPPVPRNLDPKYFTSTLYFEVFQETSPGDFGVELLPDGPLFR